jgi:hypothetical protein
VLKDSTFEHDTQAVTGATTGDWFVEFYAPWVRAAAAACACGRSSLTVPVRSVGTARGWRTHGKSWRASWARTVRPVRWCPLSPRSMAQSRRLSQVPNAALRNFSHSRSRAVTVLLVSQDSLLFSNQCCCLFLNIRKLGRGVPPSINSQVGCDVLLRAGW